jgi:Zn-dependent peptidase ImmA (M78 family)
MNRTALAQDAIRAALSLRARLGVGATQPLEVFQVAGRLGITAWFVDVPTLEGMYVGGDPAQILVSAHRPPGRQSMNCAHEIGHHVFGHGSRIDQYLQTESSSISVPDEYLANTFAANFLIHRTAVLRGLLERGISAFDPTAEQVYALANWLGVGYSALLYHLRSALKITPRRAADRLLLREPKDIRLEVLDRHCIPPTGGDLVIVDAKWTGRAITAQVGDTVLVPEGSAFGDDCCRLEGRALRATRPGVGRVYNLQIGWSSYVCVSRRNYAGLAEYRHMEDDSDEESATAVPGQTPDPAGEALRIPGGLDED